jgi:glycosyltransferase involved in cell wall biosynthesis
MLAATGGGLLVEPNDLADLSEALARLLADPEERRRLAADGHRAVHARFGAAGMAEATEGVYRRVLAGRRHAG